MNALAGVATWQEAWSSAIASGWAAAVWRLPDSGTVWLAACEKPRTGAASIVGSRPGFVIAPFEGREATRIEAELLMRFVPGRPAETLAGKAASVAGYSPDMPAGRSEERQAAEESVASFALGVAAAKRQIAEAMLQKVVLSRTIDLPLPAYSPVQAFDGLSQAYPRAFCAMAWSPETGLWIGATPELLLSWEDNRYFRTVALAGTRPAPEDPSQTAWSQKEIEEQALVSRYIVAQFKRIRLREFEEDGPRVVKAGPVVHLRTDFTVDAHEIDRPDLPDVMLGLLHPTSAVCGMPREAALEFIRKHEPHQRELYSGYWGPVNVESDTHLFVNLRCLRWDESGLRLFVGAGITQASEPHAELAETDIKAETLRSVLGV